MPSVPPHVRRVTVRLPARSHEALERVAAQNGVPLAQFVREAALMRLAWEMGADAAGGHPRDAEIRDLLRRLQLALDSSLDP